jgi:hypothetical protein
MQSPRCLIHRRFIADSNVHSLSRAMVVRQLVAQLLEVGEELSELFVVADVRVNTKGRG